MGKLIESTFVTLGGVVSSPEKFAAPYWGQEYQAYADKLLSAAGPQA